MAAKYDVAVVGLGAMGSATLYRLAARGVRAIGIERFSPGHDLSSSTGESRVTRLAYFEHPSYVPLLRRAFAAWRELEALTGESVLTMTGMVEAGHPGSTIVEGSLRASREHDLPHEVVDGREVSARYPAFRLPADWVGVIQPEAGFLRPELAIRLYVEAARAAGAEVRLASVDAIEPGSGAVRLRVGDEVIEVGSVVVSAGAWIGDLLPDLKPRFHLTRQVLGWFRPSDPEPFRLGRLPVFFLEAEDDACYGFPDFAGTGFKFASHYPGRTVDHPETASRETGPADETQLRAMLSRYMPAADGPMIAAKVCLYTRTADDHFLIDRHPADPRIVVASPCSGHGFKFASVMGEILADLATGREPPHDLSLFRLDRSGAPASTTMAWDRRTG